MDTCFSCISFCSEWQEKLSEVMSRTILSIVRKKIRVHVTSLLIYTTIFTPLVVLELLSSFRTSTRTKLFRTLVPELVLELKLWNFSSRTSTRTKIFGSVVPEL